VSSSQLSTGSLLPSDVTLLVTGASQLLTVPSAGRAKRGEELRDVGVIECGTMAIAGDRIAAVGRPGEVLEWLGKQQEWSEIDISGRVLTPGLIDPHTHPVYAGNRAAEFEMRIEGKTYEEIAAAGGGIRSTVRSTRAASDDELETGTRRRLNRMLTYGTTTVEVKSGYGLSTESELQQLRAIAHLNDALPLELVPTFLGAHEIPDEYQKDRAAYINLLIHEMLPIVTREMLAEFSDVFCDRGVYTNEETRLIQIAARGAGLKLKLHADELATTGGAELAAELNATSADHLIRISDAGIAALKASTTMAVLLPGTSFSLGASHFAPGRKLLDEGVGVTLATDCNAGSCNTESLPMAAALAAQYYRFTAAECWTAMTTNAAWALGRGDRLGSLAPGFGADFVAWDMEDYRELPFHFGVHLAHRVYKSGVEVAREGQRV
jgi:imidazolonepropionase